MRPPFCPNADCPFHCEKPFGDWFAKTGSRYTLKNPRGEQKYRCKICLKGFSTATLRLDFRHRSIDSFEHIFNQSTQGLSNRSIARILNLSEGNVRNKIDHMARQSLLNMEKETHKLKIKEDLAYDGFETFTYSQYDPNNINHLVGKDSLFVYDFNFANLNRKGRMTESQKDKLQQLVEEHERYPTNLIRESSAKIFNRLSKKIDGAVILYTDEHKSYDLALRRDVNCPRIIHHQINSKRCRNSKNPLFPVNHLDMKIRHFLKSCTRETIAFNKSEAGLMSRLCMFIAQKNFMRGKLIKGNQQYHKESPAMILGITSRIMTFWEFFKRRITSVQVKLRSCWRDIYFKKFKHSRREIVAYGGV